MSKMLLGMACLYLAGCATSPAGWQRSGATSAQIDSDKAQCEYEAQAATASYNTQGAAKKGDTSSELGRSIGDGIVIAEKRVELVNDCMRARGYAAQR